MSCQYYNTMNYEHSVYYKTMDFRVIPKVLEDIIGVLLNPRLLDKITAQRSTSSTRYMYTLLSDIASSSIMRLDPHSKSKLWDLMVMLFKWQLTLTNDMEIFDITKRHVAGISKLLSRDDVKSLTDNTTKLVNDISGKMADTQITSLKAELLLWLKTFNIKVSLLLRLGLQNNDGSFVLKPNPQKFGTVLQNLGENVYLNYNNINVVPISTSGNDIETNQDCSDLKSLVKEILGERKNDRKCMLNLRFDQMNDDCTSVPTNTEVEHKCDKRTAEMQTFKKIFGEMSVDVKERPKHRSVTDGLLDLLGNSDDSE